MGYYNKDITEKKMTLLKKQTLKHYTLLLCGATILAFGLFNVHAQSKITEGGVLGMTLLLYNWFGISPGISEICIDIVCYLAGFKLLGKDFLKNAIVASLGFTLFYNIFERIGYLLPDLSGMPLVAALVGALFVGCGVGLVVREGGASGGDDAIALILNKLTGCRLALAYFITDFVVLMLSLTYIPLEKILYSLLTVTLSSFIIDRIKNFKKCPNSTSCSC